MTPQPLPWHGALFLLAIIGAFVLHLRGVRACRRLKKILGESAPQRAVIADLTPRSLILDVAGEERIELLWPQVVDVFRSESKLVVNMPAGERAFPFPRRRLHDIALDPSRSEKGKTVQVIAVSETKGRRPYRSGAILSDGLTLVLHGDVSVSDVLKMVRDVHHATPWIWLVVGIAALGLVGTLSVL
jgi:hypothetical protein